MEENKKDFQLTMCVDKEKVRIDAEGPITGARIIMMIVSFLKFARGMMEDSGLTEKDLQDMAFKIAFEQFDKGGSCKVKDITKAIEELEVQHDDDT